MLKSEKGREGDLNSSTRQAINITIPNFVLQPQMCTENKNKDIILNMLHWNAKVGSQTKYG